MIRWHALLAMPAGLTKKGKCPCTLCPLYVRYWGELGWERGHPRWWTVKSKSEGASRALVSSLTYTLGSQMVGWKTISETTSMQFKVPLLCSVLLDDIFHFPNCGWFEREPLCSWHGWQGGNLKNDISENMFPCYTTNPLCFQLNKGKQEAKVDIYIAVYFVLCKKFCLLCSSH